MLLKWIIRFVREVRSYRDISPQAHWERRVVPSGASGVKHMLVTEAAAAADRLRFIGRAWAAAAAAPLEDMVEW